jgi:hypothetical protein
MLATYKSLFVKGQFPLLPASEKGFQQLKSLIAVGQRRLAPNQQQLSAHLQEAGNLSGAGSNAILDSKMPTM